MPLDLQPVDEETSLDLQPVEEAVPVPSPIPRGFSVPPGPAEGGIPRDPMEAAAQTVALNRAAGFGQETSDIPRPWQRGVSLMQVPPDLVEAGMQVVNPLLSNAILPKSGQEFRRGVAESLAETATGMTTPESMIKLPLYAAPLGIGPAFMAVEGAEAVGAGAGKTVEAIRQGDPRLAGQGVAEAGLGASMAIPGVRGVVGRTPVRPPPIPKSEGFTIPTVKGDIPLDARLNAVEQQLKQFEQQLGPREVVDPKTERLIPNPDRNLHHKEVELMKLREELLKQQESEVAKYASENRTPETVHGDVQSLAGEGARKVPAEVSGERVQPQAPEEGVRPAGQILEKEVTPIEEAKGKEKEGVLNQPAAEPTAVPPELTGDAKTALGDLQSILENEKSWGTAEALDLGDRFKTPEEIAFLKDWIDKKKADLRKNVPNELNAKIKLAAVMGKLSEVVEGAEKPIKEHVQRHFVEKALAAPNPPIGERLPVFKEGTKHRVEPPDQFRETLDKFGVNYGGSMDFGGTILHRGELVDKFGDSKAGAGISWKGDTTPAQLAQIINQKRAQFLEGVKANQARTAAEEAKGKAAMETPPAAEDISQRESQLLELGKTAPNAFELLRNIQAEASRRKMTDQQYVAALDRAIAEAKRQTTSPETPPAAPEAPEPSGQSLGITPPGFAGMGKLADSLKRAWTGLRTAIRTSPNKESMAAHMDAADNAARIGGVQMGNRVKLLTPNELDRKAVTFIIEAGDNPDLLLDFRAKTFGKNLDATKAIEHAIDNWQRLKPIAAKVSDIMEQQRLFEETSGVDTDFVENYIKHAYDQDVMMGKNRPVIVAGGTGTGISTAFRKQRAFDTYADAIAAGYKPKSLDASTLVDSRVSAGTKLVNRLQWGNALREVLDPTSGKPIVTALKKQPKGTEVPPAGYVTNEIIPGVRVAVHEGYQAIFDALKGKSVIAEAEIAGVPVGQIALKAAGGIKHGLLAFDTFHASRIMQKQMFLTGKLPRWSNGKTLLDYTNADLAAAVKQDLITPEMADYARANRADAQLGIEEGMNIGRIQEALYADTVGKLPVIGRFNKWVFDKVTRGAMMESFLIELNRRANQTPEVPRRTVARQVAKELNFYYGNVGRQGLFKSKTFQDLSRMLMLAPQWVEGMAQTEIRGFGQLAKAPIDSIRAGQIRAGTLAKGVGQGLVAYFLATQLLNLATRKKPTWQNEEKDHKLDAWIPDVTGKTDGYFLSPLSVVAELTHDFIRYASRKDTGLDVAAQIIDNKKAPFARAATVLYSGKDYSGTKILSTWNRIKEAAWSLAPTPIPLQAGIKGQQYPGQMQRQLTASIGIKTEPAHRDVPKIVEKYNISNREGFESYLSALAKESKKLPEDQRLSFVHQRLATDGVAPKYRDEAMNKLRYKIRDPRPTVQPLDLQPVR